MARCPKHCYVRHYGDPHVQCTAPTRKGTNCPHHGDRVDPTTGEPVCAVHDPNGKAQANIAKQKAEAAERRKAR